MYSAPTGGLMFRQLYVNDQPARKAEGGAGGSGSAIEVLRITGGGWGISYLPLMPDGNVVEYAQKNYDALASMNAILAGEIIGYRNSPSFIDEPGEWAIDPENEKVYYKPLPGENLSASLVIAPVLDPLVNIAGISLDNMAHNITFSGLGFGHTAWTGFDSSGFCSVQAGHGIVLNSAGNRMMTRSNSGIMIKNSHHITFEKCEMKHMGGGGLDMPLACHDNSIIGCMFREIAGNGIVIGPVERTGTGSDTGSMFNPGDTLLRCQNILISNTMVKRSAFDYKGCVGIFAGYVNDITIEHNEVCSLSYTGISVGWGWSTDTSVMRNNKILNNYIHDIMLELHDGGAFYSLSTQPNSFFTGNYVKNPPHGNGVYLDEGTGFYTIKHNVLEFNNGGTYCFGFGSNSHDNIVDSNHTNWPWDGWNYPEPPVWPIATNTTIIEEQYPQWPQQALDIIANAGIEEEYRTWPISVKPLRQWRNPAGIAGKAEILNVYTCRGQLVKTIDISREGDQALLRLKNILPAGAYLVRIKGFDCLPEKKILCR
jgi:hypothetical protein